MLCDDIILQHGLSSTFSTPNGIKEKCKFLKQYLEPAALRDAIDTHHRLIDSSSKTDEQALYKLVKEKALEQEKVFRLLAKRKQHPGEGSGKNRQESSKAHHSGGKQGKAARVVRNGAKEQHNTVANTKGEQSSTGSVKSKPRTGCFHCGKDHWLSQCPDLDEAAKETLLAERKAKKGSSGNNGKRFRSKRLEQASITKNDGQMTIVLNGIVELPYCADSGSDWNVISRKHVQLLEAQDPTVDLVKLDEAVESRAVGGALLTSTHAVDIRLTLNTAAGPVRCQEPKRCLIVESDEDEMLVGKTLLSELGIDIEQQLEYLASRGADDDDSFDEPMEVGDLSWAMIHLQGYRRSRSGLRPMLLHTGAKSGNTAQASQLSWKNSTNGWWN
ncbi:hypothetical protein DVH05_018803 [Phytophthora capsici]|nr:hypothetical protein DVH05_018803 [Phytophthora capsici]